MQVLHRAADHVREMRAGTRFSHSSAARGKHLHGRRQDLQMRNSAEYAEQSDPIQNKQFRRRWHEPEPDSVKGCERERPSEVAITELAGDIHASWRAGN